MKYYIVVNNQQAGPFTLDELAAQGITAETNVWTEGMANWTPAGQVPELDQLLNPAPVAAAAVEPEPAPQAASVEEPQVETAQETGDEMQAPLKDWMVESIVITVLSVLCCWCCCLPFIGLPFGIMGIMNAKKVKDLSAVDYAAAEEASEKAGKWVKIGGGLIIAGWVFYALYWIVWILFLGGVDGMMAGMSSMF